MKIYIFTSPSTNVFSQEHISIFKELGEVVLIDQLQPFQDIIELFQGEEDRIVAIDPDFCGWKVPDDVISSVPNLKAICLKTTSFSWINTNLAKERGIPVTNCPGWPVQAVVEWIIMVSLMLARKLPLMIHEGWHKDFARYVGTELSGKTAGILGLGKIGTRLAEVCSSLGMKVIYWSKTTRDERFTYKSIEEIITTADFIFPVWAKNDETKTLIPNELLKRVNPQAIFVDIYGAEDTHDKNILISLAETNKIRGYGFEAEDEQFMQYKGNVAAIPESAWPTEESLKRNAHQWSESIVQAALGKYPTKIN